MIIGYKNISCCINMQIHQVNCSCATVRNILSDKILWSSKRMRRSLEPTIRQSLADNADSRGSCDPVLFLMAIDCLKECGISAVVAEIKQEDSFHKISGSMWSWVCTVPWMLCQKKKKNHFSWQLIFQLDLCSVSKCSAVQHELLQISWRIFGTDLWSACC